MKKGALIFVVLLGATIAGMRSGIADGVLAVGSAKGGPTFGWVAGFSKASADAALNECRGKYKCEVTSRFVGRQLTANNSG